MARMELIYKRPTPTYHENNGFQRCQVILEPRTRRGVFNKRYISQVLKATETGVEGDL